MGRFINADDVGFIDPMTLGGINLYAYCGNNPIMGYDPEGTWDWGKAFEGALLFAIGTLTVAAVILSGGSCIPIVAAGYAILATAGTVTAVTGLSEVCEAVTETNPLENELGTTNYNNLKNASLSVISLGQVGLSIGINVDSRVLGPSSEQSMGYHTGTSQPPKKGLAPYSIYIQYDNSNKNVIRSLAVYDYYGRWYRRIDYMHAHYIDGEYYQPHIHIAPICTKKGFINPTKPVLPWTE